MHQSSTFVSARFAVQIQIKFHGLSHPFTYVKVSRWKNITSIFESFIILMWKNLNWKKMKHTRMIGLGFEI